MHWFLDPVTNHYFDFEGRVTRQQFWMFILFYVIIYIGLGVVGAVIGIGELLASVFSLAVLLPNLGLTARRLHDIGRSGWWQLVGLVPLLGWLLMIYWLVQPNGTEANEYGQPTGGTTEAPLADHAHAESSTSPEMPEESNEPLAQDSTQL